MQSETVPGLYPAGEGAGYAGGIISAAGMSKHRASPSVRCNAFQLHLRAAYECVLLVDSRMLTGNNGALQSMA